MNSLPPVPRPLSQRWRDFRTQGLPFLVFLAVAAAAILLLNQNPFPSNFVGEVQTVEATVSSLKAGVLTELKADDLDQVTAGQVLGQVSPTGAETMQSELAAIRADLQLTRLQLGQNESRADANYQQLRMNVLLQKTDLAADQIRLQQAESEFQRVSRLYQDRVVPQGVNESRNVRNDFGYDVARRDRDTLRSAIEERTRLLAEMEPALAAMRQSNDPSNPRPLNDAVDAAVAAQEEKLRQLEGPVSLKSPVEGVVTKVLRRVGENVMTGEALLTIHASKSDRILGFIRQPLTFHPREGDLIEVRTRGSGGQVGLGKVLKAGATFELFSQPLRIRGLASTQERGLPVLVSVPENLAVHPGEYVDLYPKPAR
jgi:multidrug resistance efflux pump